MASSAAVARRFSASSCASIASHEQLAQRLVTIGDLARRGGFFRGGLQRVSQQLRTIRERGTETLQPELGEFDLAVRDALAQREPAGPLERLRQGDRPRGAFAGERARDLARSFAAGFDGQLGIRQPAGGATAGFRGVDFRLVEIHLGIAGHDVVDQGLERKRRRRFGAARKRQPEENAE